MMEFVRREATDADEVRAELDVIGRVIAKALGGGFAVVEVQCPVKPQWLNLGRGRRWRNRSG